MPLTGKSIVAGKPSAAGTEAFYSVHPRDRARGQLPFYSATRADVSRAAQAAAAAYPQLRDSSSHQRADLLDAIAAEIERLGDELLHTADRETGLGLPRLRGERARTTGQIRAFSDLLREGSYRRAIINRAEPGQPDIRQLQFPLGPVAIFAASNFPFAFAVAGGDTASALAAGCPVVVKAHPGHPATSELFAQAICAAVARQKLPAGSFSLLQGAGIDVGQWLVEREEIEAVGFTGSLRGGRALFDAAARRPRPIPVFAEMGSVNPVLLTQAALAARADAIAEGLVASVTMGSGQFCTNPGLILLEDSARSQAFIADVTARMASAPRGVLLNEAIERGLRQAVQASLAHPAIEVRVGAAPSNDSAAFCYPNTVLQTSAAAFRRAPSLQREHFGPVTLFVLHGGSDELRATLAALEGNLTITLHAEESELAELRDLLPLLRERAGRVIWNGFPTGVAVVEAMVHGGPYPATTAPSTTSVGSEAIYRFMRPVAFQSLPEALLPLELQSHNPLGVMRRVDGRLTDAAL